MKEKFKNILSVIFIIVFIVILFFCIFIFNLPFSFEFFGIVLFYILLCQIPFSISYFKEEGIKNNTLSEYELNLIQEKDHIYKSLEIIIIPYSILFGLFINVHFNLQIARSTLYFVIDFFIIVIGTNLFVSIFALLGILFLGKELFLSKDEIKLLKINSQKTVKVKKLVNKIQWANIIRRGCIYSLYLQMFYLIFILSIIFP